MKKFTGLLKQHVGPLFLKAIYFVAPFIKHRFFAIAVGVTLLYLFGLLLEVTTSGSRWLFFAILPIAYFVISPKSAYLFIKYLLTGK